MERVCVCGVGGGGRWTEKKGGEKWLTVVSLQSKRLHMAGMAC